MNEPETYCDQSERRGEGDLVLGLGIAARIYFSLGNGNARRVYVTNAVLLNDHDWAARIPFFIIYCKINGPHYDPFSFFLMTFILTN